MRATNGAMNKWTQSQGFSLVELMIALTLGLLLSAGIMSVYLSSKTNFAQDEEVARLQENGRFAINFLSNNISMAGFYGGILESDALVNTPVVGQSCGGGGDWEFDIANPITFVNDATGANANAALSCITAADVYNDAANGVTPDVIGLKRAAGDKTLDDGEWNTEKGASSANFNDSLTQIYLRVIYETNDISVIKGSQANLAKDASVDSGVNYWKYEAMAFFIRSYSNAAGDGIPTLCAEMLVTDFVQAQCLVEGVEDLQLEFGIDSDDDGYSDFYTSDPSATELNAVSSARIYVLMRSINPLPAGMLDANRLYQMGNAATAGPFNDNFYRRVFSTTVLLKNSFAL